MVALEDDERRDGLWFMDRGEYGTFSYSSPNNAKEFVLHATHVVGKSGLVIDGHEGLLIAGFDDQDVILFKNGRVNLYSDISNTDETNMVSMRVPKAVIEHVLDTIAEHEPGW